MSEINVGLLIEEVRRIKFSCGIEWEAYNSERLFFSTSPTQVCYVYDEQSSTRNKIHGSELFTGEQEKSTLKRVPFLA